jgi:hypothetical protein
MPPRRMLVALWSRETMANNQGMSIDSRLNALTKKLEKVEGKRKQVAGGAGLWTVPQVLFVAPEYLFSEPTGFYKDPLGVRRPRLLAGIDDAQHSSKRHMDESRLKKLLDKLKRLSRKYSHILIVPGTIAWNKPVSDPQFLLDRFTDAAAAHGGMPLAHGVAAAGPHDALKRARAASLNAVQIAPAAYAAQRGISEREAKKQLKNARICFNTAPVLYAGRIVWVYNKHGDYNEMNHAYNNVRKYQIAMPGVRTGYFNLGAGAGLNFGIEVCLDHNIGILRSQFSGSRVHIHIISSAWVDVRDDHCMALVDGYVAHAASPPGRTELKQRTVAGYQVVQPNWADEGVDHTVADYAVRPGLRVYDIQVDY